jgi:signal transduction protein with GAF and PtsI domain
MQDRSAVPVAHPLLDAIESQLTGSRLTPTVFEVVQRLILDHMDCSVGTIHRLDPRTNLLQLVTQHGVPVGLLPRITTIPVGKGMAGIAAERREPVQVCNLQTDTSGVAKPGAKETQMEGSLAVPALVDGQVRAVLGVAKPIAHTFTDQEIGVLQTAAALIAKHIGPP